jgi:hypothetical protein
VHSIYTCTYSYGGVHRGRRVKTRERGQDKAEGVLEVTRDGNGAQRPVTAIHTAQLHGPTHTLTHMHIHVHLWSIVQQRVGAANQEVW